jgi:hypothetical protein
MAEQTSELLWNLADYNQAGIEAPQRIIASPELCEGDLMLHRDP